MSDAGMPATLKRMRVLIVEDEALISMLFEDILIELNCEVLGPAHNIRQATELACGLDIDAAVLDVNLAGEPIFPVAEILDQRGVPIIFSSGYGATGLPDRWRNCLTLPKPFTTEQVADVLQRLMGT